MADIEGDPKVRVKIGDVEIEAEGVNIDAGVDPAEPGGDYTSIYNEFAKQVPSVPTLEIQLPENGSSLQDYINEYMRRQNQQYEMGAMPAMALENEYTSGPSVDPKAIRRKTREKASEAMAAIREIEVMALDRAEENGIDVSLARDAIQRLVKYINDPTGEKELEEKAFMEYNIEMLKMRARFDFGVHLHNPKVIVNTET